MRSGVEDDGPNVETMRAALWRLITNASMDREIPSGDIHPFANRVSRNNTLKFFRIHYDRLSYCRYNRGNSPECRQLKDAPKSETMFNIFSKKKAEKPKARKSKSAKDKGAKGKSAKGKAGKMAVAKAEASGAPVPDAPAKPRSREILLDEIPAAPKRKRAKPVDAGQSLDAAKAALQLDEPGGQTPAGRKKVIAQALAVHSAQSRLLDDLDPELKQRLRALAMQKLILERDK
jgi:hypothetical protein